MRKWPSADRAPAGSDSGYVAGIMRRPGEDSPHQRLKRIQWLPRIIGIERALIPVRAKRLARPVPRVAEKLLTPVAIAAQVMGVVVALEQPVLFDDPGHFRAHVRADDRRGEFRMIAGRQIVSQIVN